MTTMDRRRFVTTTSLGAAGWLGTSALTSLLAAEPFRQDQRPNVLFIAIDDLNDWVGCLGGKTGVVTPNIDRLARNGTLFTRAYCSAPSCTPSRNSLLTGMLPSSCGIYGLVPYHWRRNPILDNVITLPQHFRNHGYDSRGGGKVFHALSWIFEGYGTDQNDSSSWDNYFPSVERSMPDALPINPPDTRMVDGEYRWTPYVTGEEEGRVPPHYFDWGPIPADEAEMPDTQVAEWAATELGRQHAVPFFIAAGIYRPHIPWYVPKKYFDMYPLEDITVPLAPDEDLDNLPPAGRQMGSRTRAWHHWLVRNDLWRQAVQGYMASVTYCDAQIGTLLEALESGPNAGNTVVVLWSDHGFHLGEKQTWEKFTLWEESGRVPFIISAPGTTVPGSRCDVPVSLLDIYPTLVDLCDLPDPGHLEGQSLVPLLKEPHSRADRGVVTTFGFMDHSIRTRRWRYIRYRNGDEELYDHDHDPGEFHNLAGTGRYGSVKEGLARWIPGRNVEPYSPVQGPREP
jgi:arylsulfatase A-like enzyme